MRKFLVSFLCVFFYFENFCFAAQDVKLVELYGKVDKQISFSLYRIVDSDGKSQIIDFSTSVLRSKKHSPTIGDNIAVLYARGTNENLSKYIESINYITDWFYVREIRPTLWFQPKQHFDGIAIAVYYTYVERLAFSDYDPYYININKKYRDINEIKSLGMLYFTALKSNDEASFRKLIMISDYPSGSDELLNSKMKVDWIMRDFNDIRKASVGLFDWNATNNIKIELYSDNYVDEVNIKITFSSDDGKKEWQIITGEVWEHNKKLYFTNRCRFPLIRLK